MGDAMRYTSVEECLISLKNEERKEKKRGRPPKKKEAVITITNHDALHYADFLPIEWVQIR